MPDKKTSKLSATNLQLALMGSMFLLLIVGIGAFILLRAQLETYATQVQIDNGTAEASANDISNLQNTEKTLNDDKVAVARAAKIVADSKFYEYQDQIINDLTAYAKSAGITIQGFDFGNTLPGAQTAAQPGGVVAPAGVKTVSVTVTIKNPVKYENIMRFIHAIEISLTKMQLSGVSMSYDATNGLSANSLTVRVFTR